MAPYIGGVISDARLSDIVAHSPAQLKQALWDYGVLFFKNQNLNSAEQVAVAQVFGEPVLHEHAPRVDGFPAVIRLAASKGKIPPTDVFHQDVTYRTIPAMASVVQAIEVPEIGGDTIVSSASKAFDLLPCAVKKMFLELEAEHDFRYHAIRTETSGSYSDPNLRSNFEAKVSAAVHPVVVNHPFTGALLLYVNELWTKKIQNVPGPMSDLILRIAFDQIKLPQVQVRLHWEKGDVAIWDNFGVMHFGPVNDLEPGINRLLYRVQAQADIARPSLDKESALQKIEAQALRETI